MIGQGVDLIPRSFIARHSNGDCSPVKLPTRLCVRLRVNRSEEHTSELQSLMRISYAVFCLKKKKNNNTLTAILNTNKHHAIPNKPILTKITLKKKMLNTVYITT